MNDVLVIGAMGLIVFALRAAFFIGPLRPEALPSSLERALPYILPAALMAIIVPGILLGHPAPDRGPEWLTPYLVAGVVGFGVGLLKRDNLLLIMGSAVAAFAIASFLL